MIKGKILKNKIFAKWLSLGVLGSVLILGGCTADGKMDEVTGQNSNIVSMEQSAMESAGETEANNQTGNTELGTEGTNTEEAGKDEAGLERPEIESQDAFLILPEVYFTYTDYLRKELAEGKEDLKFSLIYLDQDSIPELVYCEGNFRTATVSICKYKDGEVIELGNYGENGALSYSAGKGIIYADDTNLGLEQKKIYQLKQDEVTLQKEFKINHNAMEPVYFVDETEATKDTYEEEWSKWAEEKVSSCCYERCILLQGCDDPAWIMSKIEKNENAGISADDFKSMYNSLLGEWEAEAVEVHSSGWTEYHDAKAEDDCNASLTISSPGYVSFWLSMPEDFYQDYAMAMLFHESGPAVELTAGQCNFELLGIEENTQYYLLQQDEQHVSFYLIYLEDEDSKIIQIDFVKLENDKKGE